MNWYTKSVYENGTEAEQGRYRQSLPAISQFLLLVFLLAILPLPSLAQTNALPVSIGPIVTPFNTIAANAPYRVCLITAIGSPCDTTGVIIYSDPNLTQPINNPGAANSQGIINYFLPLGSYYQMQVTPSPGKTYQYYPGASAFIPLATNLAGGVTGSIPFQTSPNVTTFLSPNTSATDQVVVSHGTGTAGLAPFLTNAPALSAANMTNLPSVNLHSPGPIGDVTPSTGNFTTLGATGAVTGGSGSGFTTLSDFTNNTCTPWRGVVNAKDCGATGNGSTDDSAAIANGFGVAAANSAQFFIPAGTYIVCNAILSGFDVHMYGTMPDFNQDSTLGKSIFKLKPGCVSPGMTLQAGHSNYAEIDHVEFNANSVTQPVLMIDGTQTPWLHDIGLLSGTTTNPPIKGGNILFGRFRHLVANSSNLGYAWDLQAGYATGGTFYGCNLCFFDYNIISSKYGFRTSGVTHVEHNDIEVTLNSPKTYVLDLTDSTTGSTSVQEQSVNNNYFELSCGTATLANGFGGLNGVLFAGATVANFKDNTVFGATCAGPAVSTTLGTTVTVGSTPTSVTVTPGSMANIVTGMGLVVDNPASKSATQEFVTVTGTTATTFTAVFHLNHPGTDEVVAPVMNAQSIAADLSNAVGGSVTGNMFARFATGVKLPNSSGLAGSLNISGNTAVTDFGIFQYTSAVNTISNSALSYGVNGAQIVNEDGIFFVGKAFRPSLCGVATDGTINLSNCNTFFANPGSGSITISGIHNAYPGSLFTIIAGTTGTTIINNSPFGLCSGANYTIPHGHALTFAIDSSNVVHEVCRSSPVSGSDTVSLAAVSSGACTSQRIVTVPGAAAGVNTCSGTPTSNNLEVGTFLICSTLASSTDHIAWQFCNLSGGSVTHPSDTFVFFLNN